MVLSNAVRYVDALDAPTADVLDAARRLVPLDPRHVDRRTAEGYLKSGKEMAAVAEDLVGPDRDAALRLLERTARLAEQCAVDIRDDLGIGSVRYPELDVVTTAAERGMGPSQVLRARCEAGMGRRGMAPSERVRQRLDEELAVIDQLGYPSYFLTVADVVDLIKSLRVRAAARGSGAGSLVTYLLGISDVDPIRYGLLMERFLSPLRHQLPDIDIDVESARRMEVYDAVIDRFGADRVSCISMMDTYRVRHAIRDVGAALGLPPAEIDAVAKAFPHIRANQVHAALRDLPGAAGQPAGLEAGRRHRRSRPAVRPRRPARRAAPAHRAAPVRGAALRRHAARPHPGGEQLPRLPDEPVRQGRRRGARAAQARPAGHPDAVGDRARPRRGGAGRRRDRRHRRRPAGRPDDLRADPQHPHARHVPDRVARSARAGRQVRAADVRGPHHRHLAVPARAGEERHGHPVPHGPERLAGRRSTRTPTWSSRWRRPPGSWSSTSRCCRSSRG